MNAPALHLCPHFLAHPDRLWAYLHTSVAWDERMKARKTASFGVAYNYSQMRYPAVPMPEPLAEVARDIHAELGFLPNNCLLNYYLDGDSSMGFHSDSSEELAKDTGVAIVSLGSVRSIVFRSKADKAQEFSYPLANGSLLYMNQAIQEHWLHAIPKAEGVGERISLTFRAIVT